MTRATSLLQQSRKSAPGWKGSGLSRHEITQWGLLIALPVVGMLLLVVCSLLQGVFAALGPVVIFVGVKLVTRKLEQTTIQAAFAPSSPRTSEVKMPIPAKAAQTRSATCKLLTKVL